MDPKILKQAKMTSDEAVRLLRVYGENTVNYRRTSVFEIFLRQIANPLTVLLIIACLISYYTQALVEASIMAVIVLANTLLGFVQEYRSNNVFTKLANLITADVEVIRDGVHQSIPKKYLIPGDVVFLQLGSIVPADCYVLENENATIDESSLSGESVPVFKTVNLKSNIKMTDGIIYAGTYIRSGEIVGKVFATGIKSKFGKIAKMTLTTDHQTEFENNIRALSSDIIMIAFISVSIIFVLHQIFHPGQDYNQLILFIISISITVIPEALPAITTITLSNSALILGRKGIVVKKLTSLEDLGNVDLICTDKTGTLTENKLRIIKTDINPQYQKEFKDYCYLSSYDSSDPFDIAIQEHLEIGNYDPPKTVAEFQNIPFDPFKKYSARKFSDYTILKGAPELLIKKSGFASSERILNKIETEVNKGYRSLTMALKQGEKYHYLGTLFFYDKIKEDVTATLHQAQLHNIDIKVITGDSYNISRYVGREVNLLKDDDEIVDASELIYEEPGILEDQVKRYKVFCRADPIQKYKIIEALQVGHTVAYLGDGINDAPSLQLADVGIVVDSATDIAKSTADIVLTQKALSVLVDGIIQGRRTFENVEKYLLHTLTGNFGNFATIAVLSLFLPYLPMLPIQILISNLIIDFASMSFPFDRVDAKSIKKPMHRNFNDVIKFAFILGIFTSLLDFGLFFWAHGFPPAQIQTIWFVTSALAELLFIFSVRTHGPFFKSKPRLQMVTVATAGGLIIFLLGIFGIPGTEFNKLDSPLIPAVLLIPLIYLAVTEVVKLITVKLIKV